MLSSSITTSDWLSFFHIRRSLPDNEKENERNLGNEEPVLSWEKVDFGLESFESCRLLPLDGHLRLKKLALVLVAGRIISRLASGMPWSITSRKFTGSGSEELFVW